MLVMRVVMIMVTMMVMMVMMVVMMIASEGKALQLKDGMLVGSGPSFTD